MARSRVTHVGCLIVFGLLFGGSASAQIGRMPGTMPTGGPSSSPSKPTAKPKPKPRQPAPKTAPSPPPVATKPAPSAPASQPGTTFARSVTAERAIEALGGIAYRRQTSLIGQGTAVVYQNGQTYRAKTFTGAELYPDRYITELQFDNGTITAGTNGSVGWVKSGTNVEDNPQGAEDRRYFGYDVIRKIGTGPWIAFDGPDQVINGVTYKTFAVTDGTHMTAFVVDPATYLPSQLVYESKDGTVINQYSDYRTIDGLKIPFKCVEFLNSNMTAESQLVQVRANMALDPALFNKPRAE